MKIFRYKAYDYRGLLHKGNVFALSQEEAMKFLANQNLLPVEIKPLPQSLIYQLIFRFFFRISFKQKLLLIRNLYLILKSGLTLDKGLQILAQQSKGSLKDFVLYLNYGLQKGTHLYEIFASFPQFFSQVEIETIKAGEISGTLLENLEKLAQNLERQREIGNEIISNLIYPAIVLILSFGVLILLITFVLPKISILLTQLTQKPPLLTRVLIAVSDFVNTHLNLVIFFFVLLFFICFFLLVFRKTRNLFISIFLKLPFISDLYLTLTLSQVLFTLRALLSAGLHLAESIRLTGETISHPQIKIAFFNIEADLKQGKTFSEALSQQTIFPPFLISILGIASETGTLEETLKIMENFYLEEFRTRMRNFLNLLQPALLIFVGFVVGFVAIAVLVPIYQQISQQLQLEGRGQIP